MARLHDQASATEPPIVSDLLRFDRVTRMPREDLVSASDPMCADAVARVQPAIDRLWADPPHEPHLIHGDLSDHNVVAADGELVPIDFQDLQFGFEQQDLGITLADLDRNRPGWAARFLDGYRRVRQHPEMTPDDRAAFRVGRSLDIMNLGVRIRRPGFWQRHRRIVADWRVR